MLLSNLLKFQSCFALSWKQECLDFFNTLSEVLIREISNLYFDQGSKFENMGIFFTISISAHIIPPSDMLQPQPCPPKKAELSQHYTRNEFFPQPFDGKLEAFFRKPLTNFSEFFFSSIVFSRCFDNICSFFAIFCRSLSFFPIFWQNFHIYFMISCEYRVLYAFFVEIYVFSTLKNVQKLRAVF